MQIKQYFIATYGCQMNEADSLWLERIFEELGYTRSDSLEEANVILINSCSVRQAAEDKVYGLAKKIQPKETATLRVRASRSTLSSRPKGESRTGETRPIPQPSRLDPTSPRLRGAGPKKPRRFSSGGLGNAAAGEPAKRIILTGCMLGSALGERRRMKLSDLKKRVPWVDYFIPPGEIFARLPEILSSDKTACERVRRLLGKPGAVILPQLRAKEKPLGFGDFNPKGWGIGAEKPKEAYVPVTRGCDQFCSYCVVPYGRGPEISRPMEEIISEVEELVKRGVKKITLLGQNVNSYGKQSAPYCHSEFISESGVEEKDSKQTLKQVQGDEISSGRHPFAELLRRLHDIEGLEKIWFLTSNPWDFSNDLVDALALPKMEKYLHLPVQSGNDEILKKMNRPYTAAEYKELVREIREKVPEIKLGTDIIVGFPGETEEQFQNTVDLVKEIGFEGAFVAMYSPRPGTAAAKLYQDDVPLEEKKRRHKIVFNQVRPGSE